MKKTFIGNEETIVTFLKNPTDHSAMLPRINNL